MTKRAMLPDPNGGRAIEEWVGKHPNSPIPDDVQLRVWRRQKGIDPVLKRKIRTGEAKRLDHIKPLSMGGQHRESNLQWMLDDTHKEKTKKEAGVRAKADAVAKREAGITQPKGEIKSRGFTPVEKAPKAGAQRVDKSAIPPLGRRTMFV